MIRRFLCFVCIAVLIQLLLQTTIIAEPLFEARIDYGVGVDGYPISVAVGDFDGDGSSDLVSANIMGYAEIGTVSVLLNDGDGMLASTMNYDVGVQPTSVVIGDFDGDGKPDLVVSCHGSSPTVNGVVSVLLGNGDGTFQAAVDYVTGDRCTSVATGDLDADGNLDLVSGQYGGYPDYDPAISILMGNGDGTFQAAVNYGFDGLLFSVAIGDLDGDTNPDLAVVTSYSAVSEGIWVLLGNGDGTFQSIGDYYFGSLPHYAALGDLDDDGILDVVVANRSSFNNVYVRLGNGDGTFQDPLIYDANYNPMIVAISDFNGDGNPDMVVGNEDSFDVSVLLGNGDGTFQDPINYYGGGDCRSVAIGDLDNDGILDLALTNPVDSNIHRVGVLMGNGDGTFQAALHFPTGSDPHSIAIGDLNGDSHMDLAVGNSSSSNVSVLLGNGDGTFQTALTYGTVSGPESVAVGDLDGDSNLDLVLAIYDKISVLMGNGDGTFQAAVNYSTDYGLKSVKIGDLDDDGHPDLAVVRSVSWGDDAVYVLLGNGDGTFQAAVNYSSGGVSHSIAIGDLDGDGHSDLVVANYDIDDVSVLLGNGDGTFQVALNNPTGDSPHSVAIGDLDGDSNLDLAVANYDSDDVSVLLGIGDGTFLQAVNFEVGIQAISVAIGDLDGDGNQDLAVANRYNYNVSVLLGNGDGTFQAAVDYGVGYGPYSVAIGDLDGDSSPDLVVANSEFDDISVLINTKETIADTISAEITCAPSSGTVPFTTVMTVAMTNQYDGQSRRLAGRIDFTTASGAFYSNWRAGWSNIGPSSSYNSSWGQSIPALGAVIGENTFTLHAADVTPAPYNQPPYPAAGDTAVDSCIVTGKAP